MQTGSLLHAVRNLMTATSPNSNLFSQQTDIPEQKVNNHGCKNDVRVRADAWGFKN